MILKYYIYVKESKLLTSWDNAYLSNNISTLTNRSLVVQSPSTCLFFVFHFREIQAFDMFRTEKIKYSTYRISFLKCINSLPLRGCLDYLTMISSIKSSGVTPKAIPILLHNFLQLWISETFPLCWHNFILFSNG